MVKGKQKVASVGWLSCQDAGASHTSSCVRVGRVLKSSARTESILSAPNEYPIHEGWGPIYDNSGAKRYDRRVRMPSSWHMPVSSMELWKLLRSTSSRGCGGALVR